MKKGYTDQLEGLIFQSNIKKYIGTPGIKVKATMQDGSKKILKSESDVTDDILFVEVKNEN